MATKVKATTTVAPANNGSLPKGWRTVRFGDVVRDVNQAERRPLEAGLERFIGLEHIEPENLYLKQWGLLADGEISFTKRFRKGQVLFGKRRAYQRKVAVAEFDGVCSSDILTFEPKDDGLIPEFLPFIVQSDGFFEHALGTSSGSLSPRTRWNQLQDYEFPLPSKEDQCRIAEILWAAEAACQATTAIVCATDDLRRSLIAEHFSKLRSTPCPKGWRRDRLSKLFTNPKDTGHKDIEILSVTIDGRVVPRVSLERSVIDKTGSEKYLRVLPGDIVYNTMRMWQGSCGVADREGLVSPAYTVLRRMELKYSSAFWNLAFHSPWMLDVFTRYSTGVAADRWRLYFRDFGRIEVNVPPPDISQIIEKEFSDLDEAYAVATAKLAQERRLLASLRDNLLQGKLP